MHNVFIGLGSNLENTQKNIIDAIDIIKVIESINLISCSSLYATPPVGFINQPDFINAVIQITTTISYMELLAKLLDIEKEFGRIRKNKNGPRTLDLDLLLYNDLILKNKKLTVPHPRMHERLFVLIPLIEIAPTLLIPNHGSIKSLITSLPKQNIRRIPS